ncbi:Z1 domain-containing protein [Macrococcoides caseolyticum]|uniref:Z1 domain-containing protein n=1 Tax=Macrococcoides caseolyticum TaxID=69966 RepID=UPI001F168D1B|nr:Z1 domain-containing protein [Macrococcus caseolyticus]MCE4956061.1 hypothetical protein [Macrococcus caseolyticus]
MELKQKRFMKLLIHKNHYTEQELQTMHQTVESLMTISTTANQPGMLLGRIQSGKTRSFIGAMALAFDNAFDVALLFTKNSNALARQTYERINHEFRTAIDEDDLLVYDIMQLPDDLRKFELSRKMVIVAKKEKKNIERLTHALFEKYPVLQSRRVMMIDDEADYASVVYDKDREKNLTELKVIATGLDTMKRNLTNAVYLQVTATPYSLYLQPNSDVLSARGYQPKRPAFTVLVPTFKQYIGGKYYFEQSKYNHPARFIYQQISEAELDSLRKEDHRRIKAQYILSTKQLAGLRSAVINFIVGGKIRNIQQQQAGYRPKKYAFIMHTITTKKAHVWQYNVVKKIEAKLYQLLQEDESAFFTLIENAYNGFKQSSASEYFPGIKAVYESVKQAFIDEELLVTIVNSEQDVNQLLNQAGELKLRAPLNFFIGGQILDRGITIGNLIGFYYGRDPKKFQQDTVLQHSRMYGARMAEDMYVTRLYTTARIYNVMERMHQFDEDLRQAFKTGRNDGVVTFLMQDKHQDIIPCNPNKLLLSKVMTINAKKRFLPVGFQTLNKTEMMRRIRKLDKAINTLKDHAVKRNAQDDRHILVPIEHVIPLLKDILDTLVMEEGYSFEQETYIAILNYLSKRPSHYNGHVWIITRDNRNISRYRMDNERFSDRPDNGQDELKASYQIGTTHPTIMLLRQNGAVEQGWKGAPFYWPVIVAPTKMNTVVYEGNSI